MPIWFVASKLQVIDNMRLGGLQKSCCLGQEGGKEKHLPI